MRVPVGTILLLALGLILYAAMMGSLAGAPNSDAAGRGMALGFSVIFGAALWLVLAALMLTAGRAGGRSLWQRFVAVLLVPLSAVAAAMAADLYLDRQASALWVVAILPPLLALQAMWRPTGAPLRAAIVLLSLAPIGLGFYDLLPDPARDAMLKAQQEEAANQAREALQREASDFAALGPDSSLADYLPYLHSAYGDRALAGIQSVKSRQSDAVVLLAKAPLADLTDLWQFNLVPTREVCAAYGNALSAAANQITRARSDYISAAIEIEWQLPNLKWLMTAKCDLSGPLERAEANIRAVADSARLTNFADTLADIRARRSP